MQMLLNDAFPRTPPQVIGFGYKADSPFRDVRLRQAVSMMIDRDALIELNTAPSVFTKEGFDVPQRIHSHISAGEEGRWLDPRGKELGDGAKNFALSIEEAKKLLKAAGFEGKEVPFTYFSTNRYSNAWPKQGEVLMDMITQGGIKVKPNVVDYDTEYNPRYLNGKGNYDGLAMLPSSAGPDIDTHFASKYTVNGRATYIAEPLGPITDLITAQRKEFDVNKRNADHQGHPEAVGGYDDCGAGRRPQPRLRAAVALPGQPRLVPRVHRHAQRPRRCGDRALPVLLARQVEAPEVLKTPLIRFGRQQRHGSRFRGGLGVFPRQNRKDHPCSANRKPTSSAR